MAAQGVTGGKGVFLRGFLMALGLWLCGAQLAAAQSRSQLPAGMISSASDSHAQLQSIYDLMSASPYVYDPQEVDKAGDRAMRLSGDSRIYALWHVLYAYKNDQDETGLIKWRDRIVAVAHNQKDETLSQLAQFMYQAYRNESGDFATISEDDWNTYLATPDQALHDIVTLEKVRQDKHFLRWADAIDMGDDLITSLRGRGQAAEDVLLAAHQVVAYTLAEVGDYDSYLSHEVAIARLARSNAFFSQKMDMLYDLAFEAARENDAPLAEKLQKLHSSYVHANKVSDLVRWDEFLCARVETEVRNFPAVIGCLKNADVASRVPASGLDVSKLKLLTMAYARTGDVARARAALARLDAAPKAINPSRDVLFDMAFDAFLKHAAGSDADAFAKLDEWAAGMKDHYEITRVSAMHGLYQALRKELDRKSAESELLSQQVKMQHMLFQSFFAIALLLALLVSGGLFWVVRVRRMQARLKDAHDTAAAANEAKSRFLAVMSHELRTPLNGVLGMAQALHKDEMNPQQKEQIGVLVDSGKTLLTLLNDVLDMSRIEAGKVDLMPVQGTVRQMVDRVIHTYAALAREKGIDLHSEIDDSAAPQMMFDALRVYQCLSNLVSNAVKFTDHGSVTIHASAERPLAGGFRVRIEVRDTGIGMSRAVMDKLFEAYSQADTARKYGGAGLGLNISRRLAELMGGGISVTSEENVGSSFVMTFEAAEAGPDASVAELHDAPEVLPAEATHGGRKILLVDDHPVNRRVARLFLEPFNFIITEAVDGQEALDADMSQYDLVLMDLNMPKMGGLEACRIFRASEAPGKHVPIVALTADAMKDQIEACYSAGMDAHISKPILMDTLIETVTRLTQGAGHESGDAGRSLAAAG
ncbi:MAG: ATP-binding protein [Asticcacaulis sp.]